jgi:rSAM/selenodomain-associated transferase 2
LARRGERVCVVIPALNESALLPRTLAALKALDPPPSEIVVVDGGSTDDTCAIVQGMGVRLVHAPSPSRPGQMNIGVRAAESEIICLLHADTWLPDDAIHILRQQFQDPRTILTGFVSLIEGPGRTWWLLSLHNVLKTFYAPLLFRPHRFFSGTRLLFGDQAMACRREDFLAVGGFDERNLVFEEADLCLKLGRRGRVRLINRAVRTSDRRIAKLGNVRATLLHIWIGLLWAFGASPRWLKRFYGDDR